MKHKKHNAGKSGFRQWWAKAPTWELSLACREIRSVLQSVNPRTASFIKTVLLSMIIIKTKIGWINSAQWHHWFTFEASSFISLCNYNVLQTSALQNHDTQVHYFLKLSCVETRSYSAAGHSAVIRSELTATSNSLAQAILPPQAVKLLGLKVWVAMPILVF